MSHGKSEEGFCRWFLIGERQRPETIKTTGEINEVQNVKVQRIQVVSILNTNTENKSQ